MFDTLYQRWVECDNHDPRITLSVDEFYLDVVDSQLDYLYQNGQSIDDLPDGLVICSLFTRDEFKFLVDYFQDYSVSLTESSEDF